MTAKEVSVTLLLSVVGSALFYLFLQSPLEWLRNATLNAITLGIEARKNTIYQAIARGAGDRTSVLFVSLFGVVMSMAVIFTIELTANAFGVLRWLRKGVLREEDVSLGHFFLGPAYGLSSTPKGSSDTKLRVLLLLVLGMLLFIELSLIAAALTSRYEDRAVQHFVQLRSLVGPYVEPRQLLVYDSRLAGVQESNDYYVLVREMSEVAKINKQRVPAFSPW